jgi:lysozyme family protein
MDVNWAGWKIVDTLRSQPGFPMILDKNKELQQSVKEYYKKVYWDVHHLDSANHQGIANELFDTGVNCGKETAGMFLQRSLNVLNRNQRDYPDIEVDGIVGSKTIEVLNKHLHPGKILLCLNALQGSKYIGICEHNQTQEKFMNGWIERVSFSKN